MMRTVVVVRRGRSGRRRWIRSYLLDAEDGAQRPVCIFQTTGGDPD